MKLKPSSDSTMSCSIVFEVSLLSRVYNHALWNKATVDVRTCGIVSHVIECAEWDGRMVFRHVLRKLHFKFWNPNIFSKIWRSEIALGGHETFPCLAWFVGHLLGRCASLISLWGSLELEGVGSEPIRAANRCTDFSILWFDMICIIGVSHQWSLQISKLEQIGHTC